MSENLNHISRLELLDTLKVLPSGSTAGQAIAELLNAPPLVTSQHSEDDIFDIQFERNILESIAYEIEQYAFERAGPYVEAVQDGTNSSGEDRSFQYWQTLSERWSYLELMR
ncbi:MAG: hypothetical protein ACE37D_07625 [Pseudomonadales bacterium]